MSETSMPSARTSPPWYRTEPWLVPVMAAFLPLVGAVSAPRALLGPAIALAAVLFVLGTVMLVRQGLFRSAAPAAGERSTARTSPGVHAPLPRVTSPPTA